MLVPLAAVKQYLRIDGDEEDDLLMHFAETAEQICTALLRVKKLSKVEDQAIVRVAVLYAVSYLYEHREEADHRGLALTLRSLLFGVSEGGLLDAGVYERTASSNLHPASRDGDG